MADFPITDATLKQLAQFDTPTICNVIELFEIRPCDTGYMDGRIRAAFSDLPPMVGFAATATLRSHCSPSKSVCGMLEAQFEQFERLPGPAVVVFQDLDDPSVGATFGEIMCSTYKAFGSVGLITSGGGRDLAQVRALNYPVFSASTICSRAYCQTVEVGPQVQVGRLTVQTGDLLHGDANGITSIPVDLATEVADAAEKYVAAEAHVLEYVKGQRQFRRHELVARRQAMHDAIESLRRQVATK